MSEASTTPDPIELVRRFFGLLKRRAFDGFATVFTGDGVLDTSRLGLGTFEGVPALIAFGEDWLGAYDEIEWTLEDAQPRQRGDADREPPEHPPCRQQRVRSATRLVRLHLQRGQDLCLTLGMGTFKRHAAFRGFLEDWFASYEDYEFEAEELLDLGNGVSFAVLVQGGRLVGSGEAQLRYAAVNMWEDGKIVRTTDYSDIDEGRAAAERLAQERG